MSSGEWILDTVIVAVVVLSTICSYWYGVCREREKCLQEVQKQKLFSLPGGDQAEM